MGRFDACGADTAVYDSAGLLWMDVSAASGGPYPELDPISPFAQWGAYTDEQTRDQPVANVRYTTGLAIVGVGFCDPSTGRRLSRDPLAWRPGCRPIARPAPFPPKKDR